MSNSGAAFTAVAERAPMMTRIAARLALLLLALLLVAAGGASAQQPVPGPTGPSGTPPPPGPSTPGPSTSNLWGAIAFTSDGSYATSWKAASKAEAEADVAKRCARMGHGACETVSFPGELCVALANYRGGGYRAAYTGGGQTSPEAQKTAVDRCNDDRRTRGRCQLRTVVCGDGR
jgi:Domain of unknown function (DUF4189)